jgi:hypothetical protein
MDGALLGAVISMASAAVGAAGGYIGGKAQAHGTVEGVRLQLSGQRLDALWERGVEACTLFLDQCNQALFRIGQVIAVSQLSSDEADSLSVYGIGSRDEGLRNLRVAQDEFMLREAALRILAPRELAERARATGSSLTATAHALHWWCAARAIGAADELEKRQALDTQLVIFHQEIAQFTSHAQTWFSQPHPATT